MVQLEQKLWVLRKGDMLCAMHGQMVQPGDILARTIYTSDGRVLIQRGVQLTVGMVNQLRRLGVTMVFLQDQRFNDVVIEDVVDEQTKRDTMNHYASAVTHIQGGKEIDTRRSAM